MHTHEPPAYHCPFCNVAAGGEDPRTLVWQDDVCIAVVAPRQKPRNLGSLLLFPREHYENLYVLPQQLGAHLFKVTKSLSLSLKTSLQCHGITVRQNNEPAGDQDVWHYHVHITPRFVDDNFQVTAKSLSSLAERVGVAQRIRLALSAA